MPAPASGYVLSIAPGRRDLFQESVEEHGSYAEAVADFSLGRDTALLCLVSADPDTLTHVALAERGIRAGTAQRRLNLRELHRLEEEIPLGAIIETVNSRVRRKLAHYLSHGGLLPSRTFSETVNALARLSPTTRPVVERILGTERRDRISRLPARVRRPLAFQREALATALTCADIDGRQLGAWTPPEGRVTSYLDGLSQARLREDPMVIADLQQVPGFELVRRMRFGAAVFEGDRVRLTVALANRLPLEEQLGADLIYYNETYQSFVVVQYKAMESSRDGDFYRLPDEQLALEIGRMDAILRQLSRLQSAPSPEGYRFVTDPFFLKLCPRLDLSPSSSQLTKGMYLPLGYWRLLEVDRRLVGPRGGRRLTFRNVGRYLDNSEFIGLLAKGWIGTDLAQSAVLRTVVRNVIEGGRAMVLAVETATDRVEARARRRRGRR